MRYKQPSKYEYKELLQLCNHKILWHYQIDLEDADDIENIINNSFIKEKNLLEKKMKRSKRTGDKMTYKQEKHIK